MRYMKLSTLIIILFAFTSIEAQTNGLFMDGGKFMWQIETNNQVTHGEPQNSKANGIYPGDFRRDIGYTGVFHGGMRFFTIDESNPYVSPNSVGVSRNAPGGAQNGDQQKYMRYEYPIITVDGKDAGQFRDPSYIIDPSMNFEMKGTNKGVSSFGITYYTTIYSWSHPEYENIIIEHQKIINDGLRYKWWEPAAADTVEENNIEQLFIRSYRGYAQGTRSKEFAVTETNWNFWGHGVTAGISDSTQILQYSWNPDKKEASPLEDEGEWNVEDNRFWYPYYFGLGFLDASGLLRDEPGDKIKSTFPLHWWGMESWPHKLYNSSPSSFKAFLQARYVYGYEPDLFQKPFSNPHERDPDGDTGYLLPDGWDNADMVMFYGPFDISIGDTIDIWQTHLAGGIDPHYANELGTIWKDKYAPNTYTAGWSDEDIAWKNDILRTAGIDDMVSGYAKARYIYVNGMKIPKMNLVPPAWINITSGGGQVDIEWASVDGAVSYNIYRGEGELEKLLYDKIDSVDGTETSYSDTSAARNFSYYYYVTAADDNGIESSHYTVRPLLAATPFSEQGKTIDNVRVVPNPFVWGKDGYGEGAENRITFAALPGPCKITIYTVTGDIVDEIDHKVQDGSYQWDGKSKYNQYLASGVYVYRVESTEGKGSKIGKFIVIR